MRWPAAVAGLVKATLQRPTENKMKYILRKRRIETAISINEDKKMKK